MKNIPKIDNNIIIGYSNLYIFWSFMNCWETNKTKKLEIKISNLKKSAKGSLIKLFKKNSVLSIDEVSM